jgi:WD40 repeat protein
VKRFKVSDGACVATLRRHTDWILTLAFSPDGLLLASGDRFGGLQVWDVGAAEEFAQLRGHVGAVTGIAFSNDSQRLVSVGADGTARTWDLHGLQEINQTTGHPGGATVVRIVGEGDLLTGGRKGRLALSSADGTPRWEAQRTDEIVELAVGTNATRAIVADASGRNSVYDVATGEEVDQIELPLDPAAPTQSVAVVLKPRRIPALSAPANPPASSSSGDDYAATLEALQAAEAAVKSAEESLERARSLAALLKSLAERQAPKTKAGASGSR